MVKVEVITIVVITTVTM